MKSLYNALSTLEINESLSSEELKFTVNACDEFNDSVLDGLKTIGNLAFWATVSEDYTNDDARRDLCNLGHFLTNITQAAKTIDDVKNRCNINLIIRERNSSKK